AGTRAHVPQARSLRRDALRLPHGDIRRVLDEEHARTTQDRLLRLCRKAGPHDAHDAMWEGSMPHLRPRQAVPLRTRAPVERSTAGVAYWTAGRAQAAGSGVELSAGDL